MTRKNPPEQNDFLATALEQELLALIDGNGTLTAEETVGRFSGEQNAAARHALNGCLVKHFVEQDKTGHLILTESGRKHL